MPSRKMLARNDSQTSFIPNWFEWHRKPVAMIIWVYGRIIMVYDFLTVIWLFMKQVCRSIFEVIVQPPEPKSVAGEVVAIFGTGRGVGYDLAMQLAHLGAKIACVDIDPSANERVVTEIHNHGLEADGFQCDLTSKNDIVRTVSAIENRFGQITMLFHCCGVPSPRSIVNEPPPIQTTLTLGVISHFWLIEAILPKMKRNKHGHIVFLTSVAGLSGNKHQTPLSVAQFAVQGLFESMIDELRIENQLKNIPVSLVHLYPFVLTEDNERDIRLRIPSAFGTIRSKEAAEKIIEGVLLNQLEISIPKFCLAICQLFKILPRRATLLLRELYDVGVDV